MAARGIWHLARPDGTSPLGGHGLTEGDCLHFARHALDAALASTAGAGAGDWVSREAAARIAEGDVYEERYRTWSFWPTMPDGHKGNRDGQSEIVKHCDSIAAAIRALPIEAAPAVPASPRSGAGEGEEQLAEDLCDALRKATGLVSGSDAERFWIKVCFDGLDTAHLTLTLLSQIVATSQGGGAGRSERAVEIRERSGTVFVIVRTTGEYSDRLEDLIAATFDGEAAKRWAEETQRVCQALAAETNRARIEADFENDQVIRAAAKARCPDPTFEPWGDYAEDVRYSVWEIEIGLPAPAQSPSTSDREG